MCEKLRKNCCLTRGVDWQWEDQVGGNGRRGKVTEVQVIGFANNLTKCSFNEKFIYISDWLCIRTGRQPVPGQLPTLSGTPGPRISTGSALKVTSIGQRNNFSIMAVFFKFLRMFISIFCSQV